MNAIISFMTAVILLLPGRVHEVGHIHYTLQSRVLLEQIQWICPGEDVEVEWHWRDQPATESWMYVLYSLSEDRFKAAFFIGTGEFQMDEFPLGRRLFWEDRQNINAVVWHELGHLRRICRHEDFEYPGLEREVDADWFASQHEHIILVEGKE